jgi:hypothetical protein
MILAIKLRKKIKANSRMGLDFAKMEPDLSSWPLLGTLLKMEIFVNARVRLSIASQRCRTEMPFLIRRK